MDWKLFWSTLLAGLMTRLQQRSTLMGLTALATTVGLTLTPEGADLIISAALGIVGALLIAYTKPEPK